MRDAGFRPDIKTERLPGVEDNKEIAEAVAELLEKHHNMINAGNKGIIFLLSEADMPPKLQHFFPKEEKFVIKALKIYGLGDAKREYEALLRAGEIANENGGSKHVAQIPRALGFYDIKAGAGLKTFLNQKGARVTGEDVGIILMNYVRGEDLATILYKEVLRRKNDNSSSEEHIGSIPFNELHDEVANVLGFYSPGKKSPDEGERRYEETIVSSQNVEKLIKFLKNKGFILPPKILDQIDRTVELFHKNGLFHNDLHERNIVIENADLKNPRTFIIDFGSATIGKRAQENAGFKVAEDTDIIRRLSPLTKNPGEGLLEKMLSDKKIFEDAAGKIENDPQLLKKYGVVVEYIENGDDVKINNEFISSSAEEKTFNDFVAMLFKISKEGDRGRGRIINLLQVWRKNEKMRGFIKSRLASLESQLE